MGYVFEIQYCYENKSDIRTSVILQLKMPRGISDLIKSLENDKVSKISKQFYETFFEQSFRGDSVSIKEEAELSKEEQNDRIILLLSCLAILLSLFGFLPMFILLMQRSTPKSIIITIEGTSYRVSNFHFVKSKSLFLKD